MDKTLKIKNKLGLHARAAALFVQITNRYESEVFVRAKKNKKVVNGKSIMGMMMLAVSCGQEIVVKAIGKDAKELLEEITNLVENKFDEEE